MLIYFGRLPFANEINQLRAPGFSRAAANNLLLWNYLDKKSISATPHTYWQPWRMYGIKSFKKI